MWIMEGGRVQHSAVGGFFAACSSVSLKSAGRSSTQTLSSLSTARPVTPPSFHLFGRGLGQSGSNLYLGAVCAWAPRTKQPVQRQRPINMEGRARKARRFFMEKRPHFAPMAAQLIVRRPAARNPALGVGCVNEPATG